MCHMVADTIEELHAMADRIGIERYWLHVSRFPHYDICKSKRAEAVKYGAIEVTELRQFAEILRQIERR